GDLHHRQHVADRIHAGAAVFGGHLDAHQAVLAEQADVFEREFARAVVVLGARRDLFLGDAARRILDQQLLFGEPEIHGLPSRMRKTTILARPRGRTLHAPSTASTAAT